MRQARELQTNRSRRLRRVATDAETKLWYRLRSRGLVGYKFVRQEPVGPYIADFYIIARGYNTNPQLYPPKAEVRLVVECDGRDYHSSPEQIEHDRKRDEYMKAQGTHVLRLTGSEIMRRPYECSRAIATHLSKLLWECK